MNSLNALLIIAFTFSLSFSFGQSAWNKKQGESFVKLAQTAIVSDQFYDANGDIQSITTTGVYITSLYGEYGISDKITGLVYFPFFFRNTLNEQFLVNSGATIPGDELNSIGDSFIGASYALKQDGPFVLNTSLILGLPIGETSGGDTQLLQSGDGEFNQLIKLNAGYSFYPLPIYASATIGFNNRTNDFSDEFHFSAEAGYTFKEKLTVAFKIYNLISFKNGEAATSQNGIFANNTEYFAFGPEVSYTFKNTFGVTANMQGALSGQNILASPSYSFGAFYKF